MIHDGQSNVVIDSTPYASSIGCVFWYNRKLYAFVPLTGSFNLDIVTYDLDTDTLTSIYTGSVIPGVNPICAINTTHVVAIVDSTLYYSPLSTLSTLSSPTITYPTK
jgi:hypothetical protein